MKIIKTLPKEACLKLLENQPDLIGRQKKEVDKYFEKVKCKCGGNVSQIPMFMDQGGIKIPLFDDILPKYIAKCIKCGSEFDPYTGVVYKC